MVVAAGASGMGKPALSAPGANVKAALEIIQKQVHGKGDHVHVDIRFAKDDQPRFLCDRTRDDRGFIEAENHIRKVREIESASPMDLRQRLTHAQQPRRFENWRQDILKDGSGSLIDIRAGQSLDMCKFIQDALHGLSR